MVMKKLIYTGLVGLLGVSAAFAGLVNTLDERIHTSGILYHDLPLFKIFLIASVVGILAAIIFYIIYSVLFPPQKNITLNPKSGNESKEVEEIKGENTKSNEEQLAPLSEAEAENLRKHHEAKNDFAEDISEHTFEDPEVGIKDPGHKLAETNATLFSKEPVNRNIREGSGDKSELPKFILPPPAPPAPKGPT